MRWRDACGNSANIRRYLDTKAKLKYSEKKNEPFHICTSDFFITNKLILDTDFKRNLQNIDSFKVYMCLGGVAEIETKNFKEKITKGETILIPAEIPEITFNTSDAQFLEVYIP